MGEMGKLLVGFGVLLIIVGGILALAGALGTKLPFIGRLPGDIYVQRDTWSLYVPLTTSIVISVILTLIFALVGRR